jgi:hypothetical protein
MLIYSKKKGVFIMYDIIYNTLNSKFTLINGKEKDYFYDNEGKIAATVDEKSITMFYDFPKNNYEIWNHKGKVGVSFVKDFNLNGNLHDIIFIEGLCGACNDIIIHENYAISTSVNNEMTKNPKQRKFNMLTNDEKCKTLEKITGCKALGANLQGALLYNHDEIFGNCGTIVSQNHCADFDICGLIQFKNCMTNDYTRWNWNHNYPKKPNHNEKTINTVAFKGKTNTDYEEIYNYFREKENWSFTTGYKTAGSDERRAYVNSKKYQTIDENAINSHVRVSLAKPLTKYLKEQAKNIYAESGNRSLNSTKLLMARKIKECLAQLESKCNCATIEYDNDIINIILGEYNFNQRRIDKTKRR